MLWTGITNELEYKKGSVIFEVENSRNLSPNSQDYFTVFIHSDYSIKKLKPGIGFSYWLYNRHGLAVPELRPHLQEEWSIERSRSSISQRLRIENRFVKDTLYSELTNAFSYSLRPRLMFQLNYFLLKKRGDAKSLQLVMSEEFLANMFSRRNGFNENRAYIGFWYAPGRLSSLRLGYMWIYSRETTVPGSDIIYLTIKKNFRWKQ